MYRTSRFFAPVKEGEELDVKIEAVGKKGDGITKVKGFVIFVPDTKEGEEVKIRITKVIRKMAFGEVIGKGEKKTKKTSKKEKELEEETEESEPTEEPSEEEQEDLEYNFEE